MSIAQNPEQSKSNGKLQYEFVPNHGQWHPLVRYKANIPYGNLYLENAGMVYDLIHPDDYNRIQSWKHLHSSEQSDEVPRRHAIRMRFEGVQFAPRSESRNVQKHYYNYYLGNKKTNWASKVHPAGEVVFHNVYPDIDFEINGLKGLKYQWVINNPTQVKVKLIRTVIEGASNISIENNNLVIETTAGRLTDKEPYVYQQINGEIIALNAHYVVVDSVVSYEILSQINPDYPLVIDPELIFSTYSGSYGDNFGYTATYDSKANLYAGGIVDAVQGPYPVTSGAYDTIWNGGFVDPTRLPRRVGRLPAQLPCDISISKYDSAGTSLLWATYLGGGDDEYPHSLVVDRNNDLLIYGTSYSANFPHTTGCYDSTHAGGTDIIVSKLSEDGTSLLGSTFIGGDKNDGLNQNALLKHNYSDDYRGDIITDDDGNIFVASVTLSDDMPLIKASQVAKSTAYDGYLFSLSGDCETMQWGTYLGGDGSDALYSIKLDQNNNIYIGGGTSSTDLFTTDSVLSASNNGSADGLIAIYSKEDFNLKRLSYWGTEEYDQIYFIDIDADNRIFATGQTEGNVTKTSSTYGESSKGQFIFRIDTLLRDIDLQTTFGNTNQASNLTPSAFLVDVCDHIYFSGWGSNVDPTNHPGSTTDMPVSGDAVQKTTDGNDFYIIVLGRDAETLLYATYFGGDVTGDHVDGGTSRFDKKGVVYQSVCSSCPPSTDGQTSQVSDFPTTPGAAFETNPSVRCSNASFKIDLQIRSAVISDFVAAPTIGCAPLGVQFTSTSVLGDSFHWDFGDGDTSTLLNPFHTFTEPGNYMVTLTVIDSATCNILSTYKREIEVIAGAIAAFDVSFNACENKMSLENTSTNGFEYVWDFGDGTTSTEVNPEYDYGAVGAYTISLRVNPGTLCEDTVSKRLDILEDATPSIKLYNIFTPNGDGTNDCFKFDLENRECTDYKLQIFNRWGERLFETSDPRICWDGILPDDRHLAPEGTYFYIVHVGKNSEPISGIVELMK
jgi:gliding motility-associated-like protein